MQTRADAFLKRLGGKTAIIHKPENMRYLSGFLGEGALVIGNNVRAIVTDFRYVEAAGNESPGWEVCSISTNKSHNQWIAELVKKSGAAALWEDDFLTLQGGAALKAALGGEEPASLDGLPEELRLIKDEGEIDLMQKAAEITDKAFSYILGFIQPGMTEKQIALELYRYMLSNGAEDESFPAIVASGVNGSLPHAIPGSRQIQKGDFITMDFGCKVGGYCSDFTRTIAVGQAADELKKIYAITLDAQLMALDAIASGKTGKAIDAVAREHIAAKGYGECFGHGLGHGVGLLIHEEPRLSVKGETVLLPGMAVTVEPGIYLPGIGGVRIEDLCIVQDGGHRNLTKSDKQLITI